MSTRTIRVYLPSGYHFDVYGVAECVHRDDGGIEMKDAEGKTTVILLNIKQVAAVVDAGALSAA